MPIIARVGRRSPKVTALVAAIYVLLTLGGVTLVYPFLMMIKMSLSSGLDRDQHTPVPRYLFDDMALYRKDLFVKYIEEERWLLRCHRHRYTPEEAGLDPAHIGAYPTFKCVTQPPFSAADPYVRRRVADMRDFLATEDIWYIHMGTYGGRGGRIERINTVIDAYYRDRFDNDVDAFNAVMNEQIKDFVYVPAGPAPRHAVRTYYSVPSAALDELHLANEWIRDNHMEFVRLKPSDYAWQEFLEENHGSLAAINEAHGTNHAELFDVHLPSLVPRHPAQAADWDEYRRTKLPHWYMELLGGDELYREWLAAKYGAISAVNDAYETAYASFGEITVPPVIPDTTRAPRSWDWRDFVDEAVPPELVKLTPGECRFRDRLAARYGTVAALNDAWGAAYPDFLSVSPPYSEEDWCFFQDNKPYIKRHFVKKNYGEVFLFLARAGVPVGRNTFILVAGTMLAALTVNPLAAFALSRYRLRYSYTILLFCLATMAFPGEVKMIPNFLLLRHLGLLNTRIGLILPGVAAGFSIFILKGFFDSLPRELFEAAQMEGASELRMFWQIALPLAKPVFAWMAIGSFLGAYSSFIWALIVCQDYTKWTLMVWLYQFLMVTGMDGFMAGLVLASIPTLIVFLVSLRIMLRGMVLPHFR